MMIEVGTLCLIVYTRPALRKLLGRECVVISHEQIDEYGHHLMIRLNDGTERLAADKCLLPISPVIVENSAKEVAQKMKQE